MPTFPSFYSRFLQEVSHFDGYRFAISVKNPSFSTSFKKLISTNCSGLANFAEGRLRGEHVEPHGQARGTFHYARRAES